MLIWVQTILYMNLSIFNCFQLLVVFLVEFAYLVRLGKHMVVILTLYRYVFYKEIPPQAQEKSLMSSKKKYVYLCHLTFFLKCSLRRKVFLTNWVTR